MKIILIIAIIIVSVFVLIFFGGMVSAAFLGRKKNRCAQAIILLSRLPEELIKDMIDILLAYKNNDVGEVNRISNTIGSDMLNQLLKSIGSENRPKEFSSGKFGDNLSWTAMETELQDRGYTINSSKIVTGIILHDLNVALIEINEKKK